MTRISELFHICRRFGVAFLYVFGSLAKEVQECITGDKPFVAREGSDVDVGVMPKRGCLTNVRERVALAGALEDFLGCDRADLVVLPEADPFVAVEVIRGERLYSEDPLRADEYELYLLRRAGDLAPFERERMAMVLGEDI